MKKKRMFIYVLIVIGLFSFVQLHSESELLGETIPRDKLNIKSEESNSGDEQEISGEDTTSSVILDTKASYLFPKTPRQVLGWLPEAQEVTSDRESKENIPGDYSFYLDVNKDTKVEVVNGEYESSGYLLKFPYTKNIGENQQTPIEIKYTNVGVYNGEVINLNLRVTRAMDMDLPTSNKWLNIKNTPIYGIEYGQRSAIFIELEYSFLDSQDQPIDIKGYMTFTDNDYKEIVGVPKDNNNFENVYLHEEPDLIVKDNGNWTLSKATGNIANGINTPTAFTTYTFDGEKSEEIGTKFKFVAIPWRNFLDENDYLPIAKNWNNGLGTTGFKTRPTALAKPTKSITDKDEEEVTENTLVDIDEAFTYTILQQIPFELKEWRYTSYVVTDTLPKLLNQSEKIKIINARTEEDLTSKFTETRTEVAGSTKLSWALKDSLNSELYGQEFEIIIPVKLKTESDLTEFIVGDKLQFKNISTTEAVSKTTSGDVKQKETSNEAITNSPLPARVKIIKKDKAKDGLLKGADFELKQGDKVIKKGTTNDKGELLLSNFPKGKYTITETKAPTGYSKDAENQEVTIDTNVLQEKIPTFTFYDTVIQPKPKLTKTADVTKAALGQTFSYKITALNEEKLALWNGVVVTDDVPNYLEIDATKITVTEGKPADVTVTGNKVTWKVGNITTKSHVLTLPVKVIKVPTELELINTAKANGKLVNGEITKELTASHKLPVDYDAGKLKVAKDILLIDGKKPVIDPETKHYIAKVGSKLNYQIITENTGNANSIIRNVSVTDTLETGLDYQANGKVTDQAGKEIPATIKYDEKTRVLSIVPKTVLDLKAKEQLIISFDVTINETARGLIKNTGIAKGKIPSVDGEKDITESGNTSNDIVNDPDGEIEKTVSHTTEHKGDTYYYRNEPIRFEARYQSMVPDSIYYVQDFIEDIPKDVVTPTNFKVIITRGESGEKEEYSGANGKLVVSEVPPTTANYDKGRKITFKLGETDESKKVANTIGITADDSVTLTYDGKVSNVVPNGTELDTVTTIHGLNYAEEEVDPKSDRVVFTIKTGILELIEVANVDYGEQDMQKTLKELKPTLDKEQMVIIEDGRPAQSGFGVSLQMASLFSIDGDGASDINEVRLFYENEATEISKDVSTPVISVSKEEEENGGTPVFEFRKNLDAGNSKLYVNTSPFTKAKNYKATLEWNLNDSPTTSK